MKFCKNPLGLRTILFHTIFHVNAGQILIPQVFNHDTLVNIVITNQLRNSQILTFNPETNLLYHNNPLSTYTASTTNGLNLRIPDLNIAAHCSVGLTLLGLMFFVKGWNIFRCIMCSIKSKWTRLFTRRKKLGS